MEIPAYGGSFQALGSLSREFPIDAGKTVLSNRLWMQNGRNSRRTRYFDC
jgi:hypothetical protein